MATFVTNTPLPRHSSTPAVACAAPALDGEQRQALAVQVLARSEPVTELSARHQVSRKFLYRQAAQGEQALTQAFQSPPPGEEEVVCYLPVTRAWLRQVVLGLVLLCHSSYRGVRAFFQDWLDQPIGLGTVHNIVQQAVVEARQLNARQALSRGRAGRHDELCQGRQPVLVGMDLDSTYCYLLALEAHRDEQPNRHFVAVKSVDQQAIQGRHRARSLAVGQRTALINPIRGLLLEHGLTLPQGAHVICKALPGILEDAENGLGFARRELLAELLEAMMHADERVAAYDRKLAVLSQQAAPCRRLLSIPGIGPLIATALVAAVGSGPVFNNGRELAAWLGLVPGQHSTGGRSVLLGISKRGDRYRRALLIHGARAVVRGAAKKSDWRSRWVIDVARRRGSHIAAVALANNNGRPAWALLTRGETYHVGNAV